MTSEDAIRFFKNNINFVKSEEIKLIKLLKVDHNTLFLKGIGLNTLLRIEVFSVRIIEVHVSVNIFYSNQY